MKKLFFSTFIFSIIAFGSSKAIAQVIYTYSGLPQEFLVTSNADSGPGTLRETINSINSSGSWNVKIGFRNAGQSFNITLLSPLPFINKTCWVDGYTNVGSDGKVLSGKTIGQVTLYAANLSVAKTSGIQFGFHDSKCMISSFVGFTQTSHWVTNTNTSGEGSLAAAIWNSNVITFIKDTIKFNIPGGGVKELQVNDNFSIDDYNVVSPVIMDGRSQPGYAVGSPSMILKGIFTNSSFSIRSSNCEVIGLGFKEFYDAISISNNFTISQISITECVFGNNYCGINGSGKASGVTIKKCWIGCNVGGVTSNTIGVSVLGGNSIIEDNVISGNGVGIYCESNVVQIRGNKIGTDSSGMIAWPNMKGCQFFNANNVVVQNNIISGNDCGVFVDGLFTGYKHTFQNNKIGVNISGGALPNNYGIRKWNSRPFLRIENNVIANSTVAAFDVVNNSIIRNNTFYNNIKFVEIEFANPILFTTRNFTQLSGKASPNRMVQLYYDHGLNDSPQGKDFIAEVPSDISGNWTYSGSISNPCGVTALEYDSVNFSSSSFSKITSIDLIPATMIFCVGDTAVVNAPDYFTQYLWSSGETTYKQKTIVPGKYWVRANNGCDYSDTTIVSFIAKPMVNLGSDVDTCQGSSVLLNAGSFANARYFWNAENYQSTQSRSFSTTGAHRVRVEIGNCKNSDTVQLSFHAKPVLKLQNDTLICNTSSVILDAKNPGAQYQWSSGETTQTLSVSHAGSYSVVCYFHPSCSRRDTVVIQTANCNIVSGKVYKDENANCVKELSESPVGSRLVVLTRNSDLMSYFVNTDVNGNYSANLPVGNYTVRSPDNNDPVFCPASGKYLVSVGNSINSNRNFGVHRVDNHDVAIGLAAENSNVRLNTVFYYIISYSNKGNLIEASGTIKMAVDPFVDFVSSDFPSTVVGDTIIWSIGMLSPGEVRTIRVKLHAPLNQSLIGVSVCQWAHIKLNGAESVLNNNEVSNCIRFTYPYDPNCKLVNPVGTGELGYISSKDSILVYTIHFQNTGNDTAYTVVIEDTISNLLDASSIETIGASAPNVFQLSGAGIARWTFGDIMLPDSTINESASHGFVQFRIKTKSGLTHGQIVNSANIYFDLAAPVSTDTTINTIKNDLEPQLIFSGIPANQIYPDLYFKLNSVSDAALPIHYVVSGPVTVVDDSLKFTGTGLVKIRLVQEGNGNYQAAIPRYFTFLISKGTQNLSLDSIADQLFSTNFLLLNAASNTSTAISYEVISGPAQVNGNQVSFTGVGEVVVRAKQNGDQYYSEAEVVRSFEVTLATSTMLPSARALKMYPNPSTFNCIVSLDGILGESNIRIRNSEGKIVLQYQFVGVETVLPVHELIAGVYLIEVVNGDKMFNGRLIVQ